MSKQNITEEHLNKASHRLYDLLLKTVQNNVSLFIKRESKGHISYHGISAIIANIEQLNEGESGAGWEADVESKKSTFKSQFSQFEKKLMNRNFYFKKADLQRLERMANNIKTLTTKTEFLEVLKEERGFNISIQPNLEKGLTEYENMYVEYKNKLDTYDFNLNTRRDKEMTTKLVENNEIVLMESSELVNELKYGLPTNLLYEVDWTLLEEYFDNFVLVKGNPFVLNFDTFDKLGEYPFMIQCGLIIVRKPTVESDVLVIFQYNNIPDYKGKIISISEIPCKQFYSFIESYLYKNNIIYLSPNEKEKLSEFINEI